jgi:hypothetical protein
MTPEQSLVTYRSNPETPALGSQITFKLDFMQNARRMNAPEVYEIDVVFTGTVGALTGGALGRDAAKLFENIRFRDSDDVWNTSGALARVNEQLEVGSRQTDPVDIASGSTNSSYVYRLRLPFAVPFRGARERDTAIPLSNFLDGGEFTVTFANVLPTGWNAIQSDWRVRLFAYIADGRVPEIKSRRRVKEEAATQQEFDYQINGFLRTAFLSSKLTTTGYTSLAAFTQINSRTLEFPAAFQTFELVDDYRYNVPGALGTNDEFLLATPGALPIMVPDIDQQIGRMIDTKTLHIDLLAAAPTSGRLWTDVIIDRNPDYTAMAMGYGDREQLAQAIRRAGHIQGGDGREYPAGGFNRDLARKLPIRIKT